MQKMQLMHYKPAYENGQLLLEDDFIREQRYHAHALNRHRLHLHGVGVVFGLEVARASDTSVSVSPGVAIDAKGREVVLSKGDVLDVQGQQGSARLSVTLGYRSQRQPGDGQHDHEIGCYAVLRLASGNEEGDIVLATVQLDDRGRLGADAVSDEGRRALPRLPPRSVTLASFADELRVGWLRMPFRPTTLPQDTEGGVPPPFRVGPTEAVTHEKLKDSQGKEAPNTRGGGGTMALLLPPHANHIHQFRIAGRLNEKKLRVQMFKGGWDPKDKKHVAIRLFDREISGGPYDQSIPIPQEHVVLDPEYSTLSLDIRSDGQASVSLVAIQVAY
jgi:hypothetical protein